jgi:hypothetical protein
MATDHIRYDVLARDALRGVLRHVLKDAAANGLPGDHHFYITFLTNAEGVNVSSRLHAQYPEEMTIILQHQFWDLKVDDQHFEVGLSFGGIPERLVVPFSAIKGFFDPSVQFGLQFDAAENAAADGSAPTLPVVATTKTESKAGSIDADKSNSDEEPAAGNDRPSEGAEVVRLDRFRKK